MGRMSGLVFRSWIMFALGAMVTLITLSVSVSLSILVPLNHRGYVRRENAVPYIMGAGITTFVDTLLAAALLSNPAAFAVVVAQMVECSAGFSPVLAVRFDLFERDAGHLGVGRERDAQFGDLCTGDCGCSVAVAAAVTAPYRSSHSELEARIRGAICTNSSPQSSSERHYHK